MSKEILLQKERELLSDLNRLKGEAREGKDVTDSTDDAADDQSSAEALREVTMDSATLEQVQDALKRIEANTYGKCAECGKPIPAARLAAVPWTAYCIEHAG
jgi:RNA polymerase-binding protein DksA